MTSITLAFARASRCASISLISSMERSSCSSDIALTPPECSTFISRGISKQPWHDRVDGACEFVREPCQYVQTLLLSRVRTAASLMDHVQQAKAGITSGLATHLPQ
jgi:hypothetical protein